MSRGGRKPRPLQQAKILDFPGKRKPRDNMPDPVSELPRAPDWLNKRATEIFGLLSGRLDMQQLASSSHTEMLSLLADRLEEIEDLRALIKKQGRTYETTSTQGDAVMKARPEVAMLNEARRHAQSLLAEFGLSPSAVNKVTKLGDAKAAGKGQREDYFA